MKTNAIATVNGVSLDKVLDEQKSAEIRNHMQEEQSKLGHNLGLRSTRSPRRIGLGRHGRSSKGYSVVLMENLEPYVSDDRRRDEDIAQRFGISLREVRFYRRRIDSHRQRNRMGR